MADNTKWNKGEITALGIPASHIEQLENILAVSESFCTSVILSGSWVAGTATGESDIDLLFLTPDDASKEGLLGALSKCLHRLVKGRLLYDSKVLTESEFKRMSYGSEHFALWVVLSNSIVLAGEDICNRITLRSDLVMRLVMDVLDRLEEYRVFLELRSRFTGACVVIVDTLKTLYFLEHYVILGKKQPSTKDEFLQKLLGEVYNLAIGITRRAVSRTEATHGLGVRVHYQAKDDRGRTEDEYSELLDAYGRAELHILSIRRGLRNMLNPI